MVDCIKVARKPFSIKEARLGTKFLSKIRLQNQFSVEGTEETSALSRGRILFDCDQARNYLSQAMCKVHYTVGSLTAIRKHLSLNGIADQSISDLLSFHRSYTDSRQQIILNQKTLLSDEKNKLRGAILQLDQEVKLDRNELWQKLAVKAAILKQQSRDLSGAAMQPQTTYVQLFTLSFKATFKLIRSIWITLFSNVIVSYSLRSKVKMLGERRKLFQYFESTAVYNRCEVELRDFDLKKSAIDEIYPTILGAIGEMKVAKELEQLSDEYILINDFTFSFPKSIPYRKEQVYIKSIQVDHLLVSPAGIFLIETKNWSRGSLKNQDLRSPVNQIQRTNFALFNILKNNVHLSHHHWGKRKIPIRNLIVLINHKPIEEFDYVKILTLSELLGYIKYFKPSLSNQEVQGISDYLVRVKN